MNSKQSFDSARFVAELFSIVSTDDLHEQSFKASVTHEDPLDGANLDELALELERALARAIQRALDKRKLLNDQWPEDPRLCMGSLLAPFGIRNETALTRAIAWLLGHSTDPLSLALRRSLFRLIGTDLENCETWSVRAEDPIVDETGRPGRIDISMRRGAETIFIEAKVDALEASGQTARYPGTKVFLTIEGRPAMSDARPLSYARLLEAWIEDLRANISSHHFAFARLLFADIARELSGTHYGDIQPDILPKGIG